MNHLTKPNKGVLEPVIVKLGNGQFRESWRSIDERDMTEEQFSRDLYHFKICHKSRHESKSVSQYEALHIFKDDLPELCFDHIKNGDNASYWKELLDKSRNQDHLKFQERLKRAKEVPIMDVIRKAGHEPRMGYISCPFHGEDKSPSLKIYEHSNTWCCYGCQAGSSTIDFIMQLNKCNVKEAINLLI